VTVPNIPKDDPESTYRGFRKQATYILYRLLTDDVSSPRIFHPEGVEDLAIWSPTTLKIEEIVQVKDLSDSLSVSDLYNTFARFWDRRRENPSASLRLATFGPVGPELRSAVALAGSERNRVACKLSEQLRDRFDIDDTENTFASILCATTIEDVDDVALKFDVIS
jgi:hypothetical protein